MDWNAARERLGARLIEAREEVVARWKLALRAQSALPWSLERAASELVLHAGAALADGMPAGTPWQRCGSLLRIDARAPGESLALEVTLLWRAMATATSHEALTAEEDGLARDALGLQLEAALSGCRAEIRAALLDEAIDDPALRFGGVKAVMWPGADDFEDLRASA